VAHRGVPIRQTGVDGRRTTDDGRPCFDPDVDPDVVASLIRALMRTEAELLEEDASTIRGHHLVPDRWPELRRIDAFIAVIGQTNDAIRRKHDPLRTLGPPPKAGIPPG